MPFSVNWSCVSVWYFECVCVCVFFTCGFPGFCYRGTYLCYFCKVLTLDCLVSLHIGFWSLIYTKFDKFLCIISNTLPYILAHLNSFDTFTKTAAIYNGPGSDLVETTTGYYRQWTSWGLDLSQGQLISDWSLRSLYINTQHELLIGQAFFQACMVAWG